MQLGFVGAARFRWRSSAPLAQLGPVGAAWFCSLVSLAQLGFRWRSLMYGFVGAAWFRWRNLVSLAQRGFRWRSLVSQLGFVSAAWFRETEFAKLEIHDDELAKLAIKEGVQATALCSSEVSFEFKSVDGPDFDIDYVYLPYNARGA